MPNVLQALVHNGQAAEVVALIKVLQQETIPVVLGSMDVLAENRHAEEDKRIHAGWSAAIRDSQAAHDESETTEPVHPGCLVKSSIDELKLTVAVAAEGLCVTRQQLYKVISGECAVTPEMAIRLEIGTGKPAESWLELQAKYDLVQARKLTKLRKVQRLVSSVGPV
jgi:addiction module HigA family antidote